MWKNIVINVFFITTRLCQSIFKHCISLLCAYGPTNISIINFVYICSFFRSFVSSTSYSDDSFVIYTMLKITVLLQIFYSQQFI